MYEPVNKPKLSNAVDDFSTAEKDVPAALPKNTAEKDHSFLHAVLPGIRDRMGASITFGHLSGIPLRLHVNWFLIAALVMWSLSAGYFPQEYPGWSWSLYWVVGILTAFLFFASVLLHEIGHALVAQQEGVPVNSITLFIFGGVAHIAYEPETPGAEFRIVAAGPLTSLLLALTFHWLSTSVLLGQQVQGAAVYLSQINLILALFNLIPGFPLDGGRILRSALWKLLNNFQRATNWAARVGLGIAIIFIVGGFLMMVFGQFMGGVWVAFIGWYLSTAALEGYRQARSEEMEPQGKPLRNELEPEALESVVGQPATQMGQFALARVTVEARTRPPFVSQSNRKRH